MIPVEKIKELVRENGYGFNHYESPLGEPNRVVLIGERHAVHLNYMFQGSLIELLKPDVVMHEFYQPNMPPSESERIRIAINWINRWKEEYSIRLKPCDLPNKKIRQFNMIFYNFLRELKEFDDELDLDSIFVDDNTIREMVMGKLIKAEVTKTDKPLIVVVGGYHVRPESKIHEELRCQRAIEIGARMQISYVTINQDKRLDQILQDGAKFFS